MREKVAHPNIIINKLSIMIGEHLPVVYQTFLTAREAGQTYLNDSSLNLTVHDLLCKNSSALPYTLKATTIQAPGFESIFAITGLLAVCYLIYYLLEEMKRPPSACSLGYCDDFE